MRAEHEVQSCQEPHSSRHTNATADLSRHSQAAEEAPTDNPRLPETPGLDSRGEGGTLQRLDAPTFPPDPSLVTARTRVIACLRAIIAKPALLLRLRHQAITPPLQYPISEDDWAFLLLKTEQFAAREIDRYCWREVSAGVLPEGYDANSIAAEAITEFLQDAEANSLIRTPQELRKHLRRRARKIVNRLHHRMENEFMVSECDLDPIIHEDGEVVGALETFPGSDDDPAEEAIRSADDQRLEDMKKDFILFLGDDQLLKDLFACLCEGITRRAAIARKLNVPGPVIKNAQARLDRRILEFRSRNAPLLAAA